MIYIYSFNLSDPLLPIIFSCEPTNTTKLTPAQMRDYNNSVAGRRFVADDDKAERRTRRFARRYPDDECAAVALGAR